MNTFYKNFKTQLFIIVVLLSVSFGFAQTVTVPSNCVVITTNTGLGGVLGAGGKVTDGGVVAMLDTQLVPPNNPNQGGTFTFNPPSGVLTANWGLRGDISNTATAGAIAGVSGNYNGVTQPAAGLTAQILSYNKFYRTNSSETLNPSWARSKGQVKVSYSLNACGNSLTFDIFKNFNPLFNIPTITGPSCLKPNTTYTYSVDRTVSDNANDNIGFDSYYWSGLPADIYPATTANSFYTSADNSSITFTTGVSVSPFTLKCCFGRVNPNTGDGGVSGVNQTITPTRTTCITKDIIIAPNPTFITGSAPPTCVATGTVASPAVFSIVYPNPPAGQTYTWTAANTGWIDNNTLSSIAFTPVLNTPIFGNTTLTINTAGNNNPGELTLTITGPCDPAIFKYQINRNITAPLTVIPTGTTTTCINSTSTGNTFTLSPTTSNSIQWFTVPAIVTGVTLVNATSSIVTVNTTGAAAGSFTLNARSAIAACNASSVSTTINIKPNPPFFTAPNCVVKGIAPVTSIGVTHVAGVTSYAWTFPSGVTCTTNCTSANPTFVVNSAGTSVMFTVTAIGINGCNSNTVSKTINYYTVVTSPGPFSDQYAVNGACGTVSSWTVNGLDYTGSIGNIGISGSTNNILTISGSGGTPITQVCANYPGGIIVCASSFGTSTLRQAIINSVNEVIENVTISPNPNSGNFNIKVTDFSKSATAILTDFSGSEIQTFILRKGDNKIEKEGLAKGTYFIVLKVDGKQETRQIVIK